MSSTPRAIVTEGGVGVVSGHHTSIGRYAVLLFMCVAEATGARCCSW
jgi:hypothetical protein